MNQLIVYKKDNNHINTNHMLNIIKCISALCVIIIHCTLNKAGRKGIMIDAVIRFATPIFFMIAGYYSLILENEKAKQKYKARIIKLIKLIIISSIIYFLYYYLTGPKTGLIKWFRKKFTIKNIYTYVIFNVFPFSAHLWFLNALLYCYILLYILKKYNIEVKKLYKYIPTLLLCNIILGEIFKYNGIKIDNICYRNFLFTGLPFFLIGYYINDKMTNKWDRISNKSLIGITIFGCVLSIIERKGVNIKLDTYIGTIITAIGLFSFAVKNPNFIRCKPLEFIGGKLYTWIYIIHLMILSYVNNFEKNMGITNAMRYYINVIIVTVLSIIAATAIYYLILLFDKIKKSIINNKNKTKILN